MKQAKVPAEVVKDTCREVLKTIWVFGLLFVALVVVVPVVALLFIAIGWATGLSR